MQKLNEWLGIEFPFIQGGMANIATAEFAAAVSNAGALGLIGAGGMPPEVFQESIRRCRSLTDKPFGVNIMLMHPQVEQLAAIAAEEKVAVITTGAGDPSRFIPAWKESGAKVIPVVAAVALAKLVAKRGADAVIAEGTESGGHVGETTTMALVPQVVDAVDIPVIAAGGIASGRQLLAAYALGAIGAQVGTCLLVSEECPIHENYKKAVLKAKDRDTVVTGRSVDAPVRCLQGQGPGHRGHRPVCGRPGALPAQPDDQRLHRQGAGGRRPHGAGALHPGRPAPGGVRRRHEERQRHGRPGGRYAPRDQTPAADL